MYIINLNYKKSLPDVDKHIEKHKVFLKKYYDNGQFLLSGRKNPRTGGIIIANVSKQEELKGIIEEDPFYRNDIAEYSIIDFTPTQCRSEFENIIFGVN
jgi:uncharacterized protein YciI